MNTAALERAFPHCIAARHARVTTPIAASETVDGAHGTGCKNIQIVRVVRQGAKRREERERGESSGVCGSRIGAARATAGRVRWVRCEMCVRRVR